MAQGIEEVFEEAIKADAITIVTQLVVMVVAVAVDGGAASTKSNVKF